MYMKAAEVLAQNPLKRQAQALQKQSRQLSNTAKQQDASKRTQKAAVALANANKAQAELTRKLQTPKPKQAGT